MTAKYNHFVQPDNFFSSVGASVGAGTHFLRNKNLTMNGSAGYTYNKTSSGDSKGNIALTCNVIYQYGRNSFNFFINYSVTPNDIKYDNADYFTYKTTTSKLTAGISYTSSF